ncbi:cytochrome C biogenesis protein [Eikenella sp. NML96-A-049]|uniref:divalent-cation tolerance protein CutA n=1 Tax=unclassified Eikenella TaxID=2639367 RepID=UPI0007E1B266|nr:MULTISPECIES: divalent-cation tolerance protein CutA [unclassified Eikenella]OAM34468.1 cytochrome C biogenesis protein [Eikenella sp. NML070372]OAM39210.1 cytochrome C biogenesis protein [Eikenella sp. NML96-A-049]VDH00405.1 divalent cation tolerance protein [Helicobacter pametensis]
MPACQPAIVLTTCPSQAEAERISGLLLQHQLAACVQYETIQSQYIWQGKLCCDNEIRLTIKTATRHYPAVERLILEHHSYDCPQILLLPVSDGVEVYLKWLQDNLAP